VVWRDGAAADAEQVLAHLDAQGLSRYDMPEFLLDLEQIPLTASGKIRKRDIVDWIEEGRALPKPVRWKPGSHET
jgi:acyl-CoA synthetase